jgi:CUG-BP- and ETR3-like factor
MAEAKEENREKNEEEESVKLFVGQIPKHMSESQLLTLFQEFAVVDEVNIIKDKITRASRGCCFLLCPSREEADKLVNACHNKMTLPGVCFFFCFFFHFSDYLFFFQMLECDLMFFSF